MKHIDIKLGKSTKGNIDVNIKKKKSYHTILLFGVLLVLSIVLLIYIAYISYNSLEAKISRLDNSKNNYIKDIEKNNKKNFSDIVLLETESENYKNKIKELQKYISNNNTSIDLLKEDIYKNKKCINKNKQTLGTLEILTDCDSIQIHTDLLQPDELFYTFAKKDNPYVTQDEFSHYSASGGKVLATDISVGLQGDLYAPDYKDKSKTYTVEVGVAKHLGSYMQLHWMEGEDEMYWTIGHITPLFKDGDIVKTGEKIGVTNHGDTRELDGIKLMGTSTGHHSHIELWRNKENISYTNRSEKLIEMRKGGNDVTPPMYDQTIIEEKQIEEQPIVTNTFTYTAVPGDGHLDPYSELYKEVGEKYGIDWRMVSAIHCTETFDIRNQSCTRHSASPVSSSGARGCLQFMPQTWNGWNSSSKGYGVDGNGDGIADINNCRDSIHSAGNYLAASYNKGLKLGKTPEQARWYAYRQYNHANWYANRAANIFNTLTK